jgi:hypothetical protein
MRVSKTISLGLALAVLSALAGCNEPTAPDPAQATAKIYAATPAADRTGLRMAHLQSYFLVAALLADQTAAASLASQGMLEVYDGQAGTMDSLRPDEGVLRRASVRGSPADISGALQVLQAGQAKVGGDRKVIARSMTGLAAGLYDSALNGAGVDALEYQRSLGAVLAAQALADSDPNLAKAQADLKALAALWPSVLPPAHPTPASQIHDLAARVRADLA